MTVILGATTVAPAAVRPARPVLSGLRLQSSAGSVELADGLPWRVLPGSSGLTGPGFDLDTVTSPAFDGEVERSDRPILERLELFLPLSLRSLAPDAAEGVVANLRALTSRYVTGLRLVGARHDGTTRSLSVRRYQAPGDDWQPESWVVGPRRVPLRLRALDPWWSGDPRSITWGVGTPGVGLLPFLLPALLASSAVLGNENPLDVGGEVDTWPTWTLRGPFTTAVVTRGDGWSFTVDEPLLAGESLVIKTDPRETDRVVHSSAGNWWQYLAPGSQLFPLRAGVPEAVTVTAADASGAAEVRVDWSPRFEALL